MVKLLSTNLALLFKKGECGGNNLAIYNQMCGIVGYLGKDSALPTLLEGLKRLEYRGYDSAGIAILSKDKIICHKAVGKIKELENVIRDNNIQGSLGIAHTRWATHGRPSIANAHPHSDCQGKIWVVHNGIIENYQELKKNLIARGHKFKSETDTEVLPHLFEEFYQGELIKTWKKILPLIKGAYGIVAMNIDEPEKMLVARCGSPLVIGVGEKQTIIASDVSAILSYTRQVIYLDDGEFAEINGNDPKIFDVSSKEIEKNIQLVEWDIDQAEKKGFPHFMLKEIFEQPETIQNSVRGRTIIKDGKSKLGGLENVIERIRDIDRLYIVGCGTAKHAGLVGEYMFEEYAGVPTEVDYASEFRYRNSALDRHTAILAISQSGETADTLAAVKEGKEKGLLTLGIVNVVGSTIARTTDAGVYNHIGPEISVASTKAFTSQVSILALMAVLLGRQRNMPVAMGKRILEEINKLPEKIKIVIQQEKAVKKIASKYLKAKNFAYLGRKYNAPVALEGSLKLKELSYVHAEGFVSGEMKHGSIAMIDENFPSIFIVPQDSVYEKNLSNIEEMRSRKGKIIAIATEGDETIKKLANDVIFIPKTLEMLTPILSVIPLQLFAYHFAILKSKDVDKPRNLAKSVTVE